MRIYAVADIHGRLNRLQAIRENIATHKPDVLVIAGDITNYIRTEVFISQLSELPVPILAVRGNTDPKKVERLISQYPNTTSLHLNKVYLKGVSFAGLSGTIPVPFRSRISWTEKYALEIMGALLNEDTVVVVHPPPWRTLDEVLGRFHVGSRGLVDLVLSHQPALVICGHIHERPGKANLRKTLVVNCAMARSCGGAIIDYDGHGELIVKMLME